MREVARARGQKAARTAGIDTGDESDVVDYITDLLLWAHGAGFDVADIISSAEHHFRHESDDRCGQCDLLLGEDMVLQADGSYFCQDCDVSLEVG